MMMRLSLVNCVLAATSLGACTGTPAEERTAGEPTATATLTEPTSNASSGNPAGDPMPEATDSGGCVEAGCENGDPPAGGSNGEPPVTDVSNGGEGTSGPFAGGAGTGGGSSAGGAGNGGAPAGGGAGNGGLAAGGSFSAGGMNNGGAATAGAGGQGMDDEVPVAPDIDLESSIPDQYRQPINNAGQVSKRSYDCYYYTDQTAGVNSDPRGLVLERRNQPITKELNIYTPFDYSSDVEYPVIYVLHGITDNEETWLSSRSNPRPNVLLDNLIDAGVIEPVIAVFPNGNSSSDYLNRDFSNQAGYYYFANELVNDVIPFIEAEYSVKSGRNNRALCGFSMGGMQTINTGLCQSLEHFAWFGAFAAAPSTYGSSQISQYLGWENEATSYPIGYFYNVVGQDDSTARGSHEAALAGLVDASEHLNDSNFGFHLVAGGHDYPQAMVGLYNLLRIFAAP